MSLALFQGFGVELEHMIVDRRSLDVLPIADRLLHAGAAAMAGTAANIGSMPAPPVGPVSDLDLHETGITWSNELVLHLIELKTTTPSPTLAGLAARFEDSVRRIDALLEPLGARLMPSAMHPWMDPIREMRLWPHDNAPVYAAFDRIFGCRGHGWANLQSVHLNLPFSGDDQFGRLHAAIRLLLPILPALAASSPVMDGRLTSVADNRLAVYRTNARRVPSVSGRVIPEPVFTRGHYEVQILDRIYRDLAPLDPEGLLRDEWVNARGAIARFVRDSIEIRVLDVQECPIADLAICAAIVAVLMDLVDERWSSLAEQQSWPVEPLERHLVATLHHAERAVIDDAPYLAAFGFKAPRASAADLWRHLNESSVTPRALAPETAGAMSIILSDGSLATRLSRALGPAPSHADLHRVYGELCGCLEGGRLFRA